MNQVILSHVAILVPSAKKTADFLKRFDFQIGAEETFPGEGTREIYIESNKGASLLLMEALESGPYRRAFEKRGPGLHHIGIDVLNLKGFIESIAGSGWLLHPKSVRTMDETKTAYLARPGFPGLIEVHELKKLVEQDLFVTEIFLKMDSKLQKLLPPVGLEHVVRGTDADEELVLGGQWIKIKNIF